jgi:hypothetical protein
MAAIRTASAEWDATASHATIVAVHKLLAHFGILIEHGDPRLVRCVQAGLGTQLSAAVLARGQHRLKLLQLVFQQRGDLG